MRENKVPKPIRDNYLDWFFGLGCAGDVLASAPKLRKGAKEISEALALISAIRPMCLADPGRWTVLDLCAGNALTSLIAVHLFKVKRAIAVDIAPRGFRRAPDRFESVRGDVHDHDLWKKLDLYSDPDVLVVSAHPCKGLAQAVVSTFRWYDAAKHLALLPCCVAMRTIPEQPGSAAFGPKEKYAQWCHTIAAYAGGTYRMDENCLSPCRGVVRAFKREYQMEYQCAPSGK